LKEERRKGFVKKKMAAKRNPAPKETVDHAEKLF